MAELQPQRQHRGNGGSLVGVVAAGSCFMLQLGIDSAAVAAWSSQQCNRARVAVAMADLV